MDSQRFTVSFSDFGTDSNADTYTEYAGTVPPPAYDERHFDLSLDESAGRSNLLVNVLPAIYGVIIQPNGFCNLIYPK